MNPQAKQKTGTPREAATRQARKVPREWGDVKKATKPDEAATATAMVRQCKRERTATPCGPPDHHSTLPPAAAKAATGPVADTAQEPAPPGPKAANTRTEDGGTPEAKTAASAPMAHPTTKDRPDLTNTRQTRETSGNQAGARSRPPTTATKPGAERQGPDIRRMDAADERTGKAKDGGAGEATGSLGHITATIKKSRQDRQGNATLDT